MKPIQYSDGSHVTVGDEVTLIIKRLLGRKQCSGIVKFVCDVRRPIQREVNDYGVAIDLVGTNRGIWYGGPELPPDVVKVTSKFDFEVLEPWEEIVGDGQRFVDELKLETGKNHALSGVVAKACARRADCDDVLFRILGRDEEFAVVHLTWSGRKEANELWPLTKLYRDLGSWRSDCMNPDHEGYTA